MGDALERTDDIRIEAGLGDMRAAAAAIDLRRALRACGLADHGDRLAERGQWQNGTAVLQQDGSLLGELARELVVRRGGHVRRIRPRLGRGRVVKDADAEHRAQDPQRHVVQPRHRHLAVEDGLFERIAEVAPVPHLHVHAGVGRGHRRMRRAPVGHDEAVEAVFLLQQRRQERRVLAGPGAVHQVVGAHDRAGLALLDGDLEGLALELVKRALVDVLGDRVAVRLLAVLGVVLRRCDHVVLLDPLDLGGGGRPREVRILAERLEVAPVHRHSGEVEVGRQHDVDPLVPGFPAERVAEAPLQGRIPGRGLSDRGRKGCRVRLAVSDARAGVVQGQVGDAEGRVRRDVTGHPVVDEDVAVAVDHCDLLVERHRGEQLGRAPVGRLGGVHPGAGRGRVDGVRHAHEDDRDREANERKCDAKL